MSKDVGEHIILAPGEGAIVFSEDGIKMYAPLEAGDVPLEVRDTMDFVTFALMKTEWILEFYESIATAEALVDLMGKKVTEPPKLTLIKGGLYDSPAKSSKTEEKASNENES